MPPWISKMARGGLTAPEATRDWRRRSSLCWIIFSALAMRFDLSATSEMGPKSLTEGSIPGGGEGIRAEDVVGVKERDEPETARIGRRGWDSMTFTTGESG